MPPEPEELLGRLREGASARALEVWEGYPYAAPFVTWENVDDVPGFLDAAVRLGARVLYVDAIRAGFAIAGVMHALPLANDEDEDERVSWSDDSAHLSWRSSEYDALTPELRAKVDAVVADMRYDTHRGDSLDVLVEYGPDLSTEEFAALRSAARLRFDDTVAEVLDVQAQLLAAQVVQNKDFDPVMYWSELEVTVRRILGLEDPRLVRRVAQAAWQLNDSSGARDRAETALLTAANEMLATVPQLLLDEIGFAGRPGQRASLLAPFLEQRSEWERRHLPSYVDRVLSDDRRRERERERRYATAARLLLARGATKAAHACPLRSAGRSRIGTFGLRRCQMANGAPRREQRRRM